MRWKGALAVVIVALAGVIAPVAGAQVFLDPAQRSLELVPGETTNTSIAISNPANRSYVVQAEATGNLSDHATMEPARFPLRGQGQATVDLSIQPPLDTDFSEGDFFVRFTFIDRETGEPIEQRVRLSLDLQPRQLYLGMFSNPLPEPYTGQTWLFGLELATWGGISLFLAAAMGTVVHTIVPRASQEVQDIMAGKMRAPFFLLPLILGVNFSWRLLPETPAISAVSRVLDAISIVILAVVAYRTTSAGLVYYGENIADTTETTVDDVLVPVLEKLGAALIVAVAGFYTFKALGVDFSFLVAGGLVAGLVISMAAQDTLSNFFSGLHILIDRPFREGDVLELETGEVCRVEDIGLRSTKLYHFQRHQQLIAPNNELAQNRIVNMTYPDRQYRITIPVGVAYGTDLEEATRILYNVAMDTEEVLKGRTNQPKVYVKGFGESAIQLELRAYVPDERDRNPATTHLVQQIHAAFQEAGIEIPFPQRVIHVEGEGVEAPLPEAHVPSPSRPSDGEDS